MERRFSYSNANEFAQGIGLLVGGAWIASFLAVVLGFPSVLSEVGYMLGLVPIPLVGIQLRRMRMFYPDMTWVQAIYVSFIIYMCSVLLLTIVQAVYFMLFDNGTLAERMYDMLCDKQIVEAYAQAGSAEMLEQLKDSVLQLSEISVAQLSMSFLFTNSFIATISALFSAVFALGVKREE